MKSRLIVNPVSGSDSAPNYLQIINERLRERVGEMDIVMTVAAGDAVRAAQQAVEAGFTTLFVAGGDGTLNEVINGVAQTDGALDRVTFGVLPLGTGNDFATALGISEDVESALDTLLEGHVIKADLCTLNERYFINVSAGGFIAEVSSAVNPELKTVAGKFAYLIGGAQVLLDYEPVMARFKFLTEDGRRVERTSQVQMFAVCNSRMVGGGRLIAPHAIIDDGLFDCCVVESMPMLDFINLLTRVSGGDHLDDERVSYFRAREIHVALERTIKVNTDGEVLEADHCHYSILPHAVRFLAGKRVSSEQ